MFLFVKNYITKLIQRAADKNIFVNQPGFYGSDRDISGISEDAHLNNHHLIHRIPYTKFPSVTSATRQQYSHVAITSIIIR